MGIIVAHHKPELLPGGIEIGPHAKHRLSNLINAHLQKRPARTVLKLESEENDSVYLVSSGWLCVSKSTRDGKRLIIDVLLPGNLLDPASADACTSTVEIEALTNVTYAAIPRNIWLRFVAEHRELGGMLQCEFRAALTRMSERMLRLGKGDAESIIAFALCELGLRSTGLRLPEVREFHIPMTQQQLGDLCGLSSVHICRTLRRLQRQAVITVRDHMDITIHDIDALADIAEIDPDSLRKEIVPRRAFRPRIVAG